MGWSWKHGAVLRQQWIAGGVTAAHGFAASGVSAGIKRGKKLDLALVVSDAPATAAGVFTTNAVQAAPVQLSRARLRGGRARAVLINSGNANCLTGARGLRDAQALGQDVADALGIHEHHVLLASTGIIGQYLPLQRMRRSIPALIQQADRQGHAQAARAMLTTDTGTKEVAVSDRIGGSVCRLGGMAKGAGMMAPHMATMLCVLTTDVAIDHRLLSELLREAVQDSFNRISIDGEMSTNDSVLILANGRSGVKIPRHSPAATQFGSMLSLATRRLARLLIEDGEGTTCVAYVGVAGARTQAQARGCARQVASSPLVKTMLAGADPNIGRIAAAVGASGAFFDPQKLQIRIGGLGTVVRAGTLRSFDAARARQCLRPRPPVYPAIYIDLHAGGAAAWMLMSDLTEEYVRMNARYST